MMKSNLEIYQIKRFKQVRANIDITQDKLALSLETNQQSITNIESGRTRIGIDIMYYLHIKYGINLNWLICGKQKMKQTENLNVLEDFVFSNDLKFKFKPGKKHLDPRQISKFWVKLREIIGFGQNIKFYSLNDTGIIDLLAAGVSIEDVRDQADHHNISVTAIYAKHAKPHGSNQIRKLAKEF
jgi:DNA-binding XRE family transcriptional regulator